MGLLSNVRFGINAGVIDGVDIELVDEIINNIQPATMVVNKGEKIAPRERDILRAGIISDKLK
jgi:protein arginine kinase